MSGVLFGYIALLQVAAIFLAFGTRKVKVKGLNDSLYIAAIIYITSILWVAIILVSVLLNNRANTYSVLLATIIFISASVLGLVFVPKVYYCNSSTVFSTFLFFETLIVKLNVSVCYLHVHKFFATDGVALQGSKGNKRFQQYSEWPTAATIHCPSTV